MSTLDTAPLVNSVEQLADRLRALPQSALRKGAAEEGLALARELATRAQRLEFTGPAALAPRRLPDAGLFAVGDQLAVVGQDLALAIEAADPETGEAALTDALQLVRSTARAV